MGVTLLSQGIWQLDAIFGLNPNLTVLFLLLSFLVFLWGFERYRTTFARVEFGVALIIALGILVVGIFPVVFEQLANLMRLEEPFRAVQITANVTFVCLLLYVVSMVNDNRQSFNELSRNLALQQSQDAFVTEDDTIFVVIPAYNEAATVGDVVASLPKTIDGYEVVPVVVSDGSNDGTHQIAATYDGIAVEHPITQGQGGALITGFEIACRHDADTVVTMDADGQHPADQIEALVAPILSDDADYVIGSRYRGSNESDNSVTRRTGIRTFTWLINAMTKTNITDCTNGFRAIRGDCLGELTLTEERFSAPELIIEARKNGLRIQEVPITILERDAGQSKKPKLGYALGLFRTILVTWIR